MFYIVLRTCVGHQLESSVFLVYVPMVWRAPYSGVKIMPDVLKIFAVCVRCSLTMPSPLVLLLAAIVVAYSFQGTEANFKFSVPGKWAGNKRGGDFKFSLPGERWSFGQNWLLHDTPLTCTCLAATVRVCSLLLENLPTYQQNSWFYSSTSINNNVTNCATLLVHMWYFSICQTICTYCLRHQVNGRSRVSGRHRPDTLVTTSVRKLWQPSTTLCE